MTNSQSKANMEFGEYDNDRDIDERGTAYPQDGKTKRHGKQAGVCENAPTYSSERLKELARPKEPHIGWQTSVRPYVMWGTQDLLWPVSPRAMSGNASPRVEALAAPKKNFQQGTVYENRPLHVYSMGRPSMIWKVSEGAMKGSASERVQYLSQHKHVPQEYQEESSQFYYSCGRESPIWTVKASALQSKERPRTTALANPKDCHPEFQGERSVESIVSNAARMAVATSRIANLADPKTHSDGPFRDPQWKVSQKAKSSVASARCLELAQSKPLAEGFRLAREVEWPVSKAAMHAHASERIEQLAQPITRATMDHVQFNPEAFTVKESALKGVIPRRIEELSRSNR